MRKLPSVYGLRSSGGHELVENLCVAKHGKKGWWDSKVVYCSDATFKYLEAIPGEGKPQLDRYAEQATAIVFMATDKKLVTAKRELHNLLMDPRVSWTAPVVIMITVTDSSKDSVRGKTRKHLEDKFRLNYKLSPRRSRVIIIPESKQHRVSDKIGGFGGRAIFINEALCWLRRECCND